MPRATPPPYAIYIRRLALRDGGPNWAESSAAENAAAPALLRSSFKNWRRVAGPSATKISAMSLKRGARAGLEIHGREINLILYIYIYICDFILWITKLTFLFNCFLLSRGVLLEEFQYKNQKCKTKKIEKQ